MGMTIDKSIENIVLLKKLEDSLGNISGNTNSVASQSLGCAIDTMRKYQKIEQIINNAKDSDGAVKYNWLYEQIREVVEDGKID
jgi:hypothetical protein